MDIELLRANLVRTIVPLIVGALVSLLPALQGHDQLSTLIGFGVSAGYYAVFRIAETRYPWVGLFLGKRMVAGSRTPADVRGRPVKVSSSPLGASAPGVGGALRIRVDGTEIEGVESFTWNSEPGQPPSLTLRLRDPQVEFSSSTAIAPATAREAHDSPPAQRRP